MGYCLHMGSGGRLLKENTLYRQNTIKEKILQGVMEK